MPIATQNRKLTIRLTIDTAATAGSPKAAALVLSTIVDTLLSPCRHKEGIQQLSLFESVKSRRERETEELFNRLSDWVKDTLEIEDKPYLRVIAVLKGV